MSRFLISAALLIGLCCAAGAASTSAPATSASQPDTAKTKVEYVQLLNTNASDAARILNTMFSVITPVKSAAASQPSPVSATVDARTNTVILSGSPERVAGAVILLRKMDTLDEGLAGGTSVFFIYHLKQASAAELAALINQTFGTQSTATATRPAEIDALAGAVHVVANPDTNSLLITTDKEMEQTVRELIKLLDHSDAKAATTTQTKPGLP